MKSVITEKEYLKRKVDTSNFYSSDKNYLELANSMLTEWNESGLFTSVSEELKKDTVLCLTGYMLDICADMGLWRAFTSQCTRWYGQPVPFYDANNEYVEYELNSIDVRFLLWYSLSMANIDNPVWLYPYSLELKDLADRLHAQMEKVYDDLPAPEGMINTNELDMYDPDDADTIALLGRWLYWSSYLLVPAFKSNMYAIYTETDNGSDKEALVKAMELAQMQTPTGPLALYLREWVWLVVTGKIPVNQQPEKMETHPYFEGFKQANNGSRIAFFKSYIMMNRFLGRALGWDPKADNLPDIKKSHDFTLLVNKTKGMLIARDVARIIYHEGNKYYEPATARLQAFTLLSTRGRCPIDLTTFCLTHSCLPDIRWPGHEESNGEHPEVKAIIKAADFLARLYLLQYYRAV